MSNQWQRFCSDRGGMILVVAIPMAALLVGLLWYVATVGDAVLYRERIQDAADATAFESAVLHARGMNAISLLNILMALLMSIIVAFRAAEIVLAAGLVFFGATASPLASTVQMDLNYSPKIEKAVEMVAQIEKIVAASAPVFAAIYASADNTTFYRGDMADQAAEASMAFSHALFPAQVDEYLRVAANNRAQLELARGGARQATRLGATLLQGRSGQVMPSLPLEADSYDKLCKEAIGFGATQFIGMIGRIGGLSGVASALEKFADLVTGFMGDKLNALFCQSAQSSAAEAADLIGKSCDDSKLPTEAEQQEQQESGSTGSSSPPDPSKPDPSRTRESAKQDTKNCKQDLGKTLKKFGGDPDAMRPAKVWKPAYNGNVLLQTWAFAFAGEPRFRQEDEAGLRMAAPSKNPKLRPNRAASAQAEYYYHCDARYRGLWQRCEPNATWSLGWTARMRRFWWPLEQAERASALLHRLEQVFGAVDRLIREGLGDFSGGGNTHKLVEGTNTALLTRDVLGAMTGPAPKWIH